MKDIVSNLVQHKVNLLLEYYFYCVSIKILYFLSGVKNLKLYKSSESTFCAGDLYPGDEVHY
jgi:hypothetical protein